MGENLESDEDRKLRKFRRWQGSDEMIYAVHFHGWILYQGNERESLKNAQATRCRVGRRQKDNEGSYDCFPYMNNIQGFLLLFLNGKMGTPHQSIWIC